MEALATLEVLEAPVAPRLYFWALQASFVSAAGRRFGTAHTGLQWNPRHPGSRAVNWGGYAQASDVTSVLDGSVSALPGIPGDANTRNFDWQPGVGYRFRIHRVDTGWRSEVTDTGTGRTTVIRDLYAGGDRVADLVVWSELFCACTDPQVVVRWSDLHAVAADGTVVRPRQVGTTFPAGGCPNVDSVGTPEGIVQVTGTVRRGRDGGVVPIGEP